MGEPRSAPSARAPFAPEPAIQAMADEITKLLHLKGAYKQAWSDLEDAVGDALAAEDEPWPTVRQRLSNAADVVRERLEANR